MASYNRIKASKIAPIGTIMPWGGGSKFGQNADNIPPGWIICNSSAAQLYASDYPILAKIMGNTYGPFPETNQFQIGINFGIVNDFPYNPPPGRDGHDPNRHVDIFALPNLNQRALIDIEGERLSPSDLQAVGEFISKNGTEGTQPKTLIKTDVDITFDVEASDELAGRITGIVMDDPIYFDTVYVMPRKLGIDHTPQHNHRPASTNEGDQFWAAFPTGSPVMEFQPGTGLANDSQITSITAIGNRGDQSAAHSFIPGKAEITWYDEFDGGISSPLGDVQVNINSSLNKVPKEPSGGRQITAQEKIEVSYTDDNRAIETLPPAEAHTGAFPPAGRYQGKRNFYASPDIPAIYRGDDMPSTYIEDSIYDPTTQPQPINTDVTNTYTTTLNHDSERWLSTSLRSHTHESMEITMTRGSLAIPSTTLVNNVSTSTVIPVSVDTALNVTINPNTPSLTIMYIIRAF